MDAAPIRNATKKHVHPVCKISNHTNVLLNPTIKFTVKESITMLTIGCHLSSSRGYLANGKGCC